MPAAPSRPRALPLAIAVALLVFSRAPSAARAQDEPAGAFLLTTSAPEVAQDADYGLLLREIGRQALLIAAREQLHLPTRDEAIGDPVPPEARPFDVSILVRPKTSYRIRLAREGKVLWEKELPIEQRGGIAVDITQLVDKFEPLSRGEMVTALKKAGLAPRAPDAHLAGGRLPGEAESLLWQMSFLPQFEAVRQAHAQTRQAGESPELTGALVRGYANLGQLLNFLWCPAHKAFTARSLLYAQRMVALHPNDPASLYHRAYARAMAGLHASALKDLDAADALAKKGGVEAAGAGATPAWSDLIRSLCRYETAKLSEAGVAGGNGAPLAMYLAFLTVETAGIQSVEVGFAQAALQVNPECLRLIDAICNRTGPGPLNTMTEAGPAVFGRSLGQRLEGMSLPLPAKDDLAKRREAAGAAPAPGRMIGRAVATSISPARPAVVQMLIDNGAPGRDDGEPSVAALGDLIRQVTFVHAWRRADLIARKWGQDARPYCAAVRPLIAGHRYAAVIDAYGLFHSNAPAVWGKPLASIEPKDPGLSTWDLWNMMRAGMINVPNTPGSPFFLHGASADDVAWDMERLCTWMSHPKGNPRLPDHLARLKEVSPYTPVVAAITIESDWAAAEPHVAEWERQFGDHPALAGSLTWKYLVSGKYDEAERWAKRYLKSAPEAGSYMMLAETYRLRGQDDAWVNTLEQYLASGPDMGLDAAKVRVRIVEHLLCRGKAQQALPHAEQAAASGAAWALNCAAIANERAGNWDAAEQYMKENAEHYEEPDRYYGWCLRTGHGDVKAARAAAQAQLKAARGRGDRESVGNVAAINLIEGKPAEALAALKRMYEPTGDPWAGLNAAMIAPDAAARDAALDAVLAKRTPVPQETATRPQLVEFAQWLRDNWASGGDKALDLSAVDKIAAKCVSRPADASNIYYLTAKFLQQYKRDEEATNYLRRAAAMVLVESPGTDYTLAWIELRAKGIDPAKLPLEPPPGHNELVPEIRRDE
jgi:tetratricopeptide (TPR) repeat protein